MHLSITDHLFLGLDRKQPMHIAVLCFFSVPDNQNSSDFLKALYANMAQSPKKPTYPFNQKLHRRLFWQTVDAIDVNQHFFYHHLGGRELLDYVGDLHSQRLAKHRPMWQLFLLDGLKENNDKGQFAIYLKMHHALVDGVGGMRVLQATLSEHINHKRSLPFWSLPPSTKHKPKAPTKSTLRPIATALKKRWQDRQLPSFTSSFSAPKSPLNQRIDHTRTIGVRSYDKSVIKGLARHFCVSDNDMILALCAGALRRYLLTTKTLPKRPLIGFIPISLRDDDSIGGNRLSFLLGNLATHVDDPLARLHAISQSTTDSKHRLKGLNYKQVIGYSLAIYGLAGLNLLTGVAPRRQGFNLIISNTPSTDRPLYLDGARLDSVYPLSVLLHGQALNITLVNYAGHIDLALTACTTTLPNISTLLDGIQQELLSYQALAVNPPGSA